MSVATTLGPSCRWHGLMQILCKGQQAGHPFIAPLLRPTYSKSARSLPRRQAHEEARPRRTRDCQFAAASLRVGSLPHVQDVLQANFYRKKTDELQKTLARPIEMEGVGLHSGDITRIRLLPAPAGYGRCFVRVGGSPELETQASVYSVTETVLSTALGEGIGGIRTVEHLLSALEGLSVDNVRIEFSNGSEAPILDGSALQWVEAVHQGGIVKAEDLNGQPMQRHQLAPQRPITVQEKDSFITALPAASMCLTYGINFPQLPAVGRQWYSWCPEEDGSDSYATQIAPARTFGIKEQVEQLRSAGLIKGGSLDNAIVCSMTGGWEGRPLRFPDEPCRHKLLDLIGDLALCNEQGHPGLPQAHIVAYKASHGLHVKFGKALMEACKQDAGAL